jgi:hypothetical protein
MSITKLPLAGNNLIIPGQGEFGKVRLGFEVRATKAELVEFDFKKSLNLRLNNKYLKKLSATLKKYVVEISHNTEVYIWYSEFFVNFLIGKNNSLPFCLYMVQI